MKHIALAVVLLFFTVAAKAKDHTVRLRIEFTRSDAVGWHSPKYFERYKIFAAYANFEKDNICVRRLYE